MAVPVSEASLPEGAAEPGRTSAELSETQGCLPFQRARLLESKTKVSGKVGLQDRPFISSSLSWIGVLLP